MKSLIKKVKKIITKELVVYGIVGVCTTIVNLASFYIICNVLGVPDLTANVIAWIIAVVFAYVTNDIVVFHDKHGSFSTEVMKVVKFFAARLLTLGIEEAGLFIFVTKLNYNNMIVKAVLAIIVILVNYVFSKLYIFNHKTEVNSVIE